MMKSIFHRLRLYAVGDDAGWILALSCSGPGIHTGDAGRDRRPPDYFERHKPGFVFLNCSMDYIAEFQHKY